MKHNKAYTVVVFDDPLVFDPDEANETMRHYHFSSVKKVCAFIWCILKNNNKAIKVYPYNV